MLKSQIRSYSLTGMITSLLLVAACAGEPETSLGNGQGAEPMSKGSSTAPRVEGQLMIRFKDSVDPARAREILEQEGAEILTTYSDARMFHIGLPAEMTVEQGIKRFSIFEELDFVEPNQVYTTQDTKE